MSPSSHAQTPSLDIAPAESPIVNSFPIVGIGASAGGLGLWAIKEAAGVALAQEPASAKFDAMPRSAIDARLVGIVAPAGELYIRLVTYLGRIPVSAPTHLTITVRDWSSLDKVVILLRTRTGHDFSLYKKSTLYRRIGYHHTVSG